MNISLSKINRPLVKEINRMAVPLILNSVTAMLIGLIDMAMIGRISLNAFGAVGLISTTINSITGVLGMIAVAFNISGAKNEGEGNGNELSNKFKSGLTLSVIIGLLFYVFFAFFASRVLVLTYDLSGNILDEAVAYVKFFSMTIGLNMILFMFSSYFKIINQTKYLFYGNITSTITNVILNYILIFGKLGIKPLGVKGAGLASVIALSFNIFIYALVVYKNFYAVFKRKIDLKNIMKTCIAMLRGSIILMGQEILESTIIVICINAILSRIGVLELSVYTLLLNVVGILLMPMYAYASTSLTIISKNFGKKDFETVKKVPKICLKLAFAYCLTIAVIFIIFRNYIPGIITDDILLIRASIQYFIIAITANLSNISNTIYKYSLQGIGDERWVFFNSTILNFIGLILIFMFGIYFKLSLNGVYIGIFMNYLFLGIFNSSRYHKMMIKY